MFDEAGEDEILLAAMMRLGAKRGFKWTKRDVAEQTVRLAGTSVPEAVQLVRRALTSVGQPVAAETRDDGSAAVRALLGVGVDNLDPAVVTAIVAADGDDVMIHLRAAGREGLIKQHPADKALAKVMPLLAPASQ